MYHLRLPQPGGPGFRTYIPQEQGGPFVPRALGSLYVAPYDWQGVEGILTRLKIPGHMSVRVRVSLRLTVSQYVLELSPLCGRLTRYCFIFKSLGLQFVVLSLSGGLSDESPGLSFVSHSLVICLCVHLLFTFLPFTPLPYIYIYTHYTIHITYTRTRPHLVPAQYSRLCHTTH
jgi:hypothetical protein